MAGRKMSVVGGARRVSVAGGGKEHWASKCKIDFSKEFGDRDLPMERDTNKMSQVELEELETFFNAEAQQKAAAMKRRASTRISIGGMLDELIPIGGANSIGGKRISTVGPSRLSLMPGRDRSDTEERALSKLREGSKEGGPMSSSSQSNCSTAPVSRLVSKDTSSRVASKDKVLDFQGATSRGSALPLVRIVSEDGQRASELFKEELSQVLYTQNMPLPGMDALSAKRRVHRPVSPEELLRSVPPQPLGEAQPQLLRPMFERARDEPPEETHYEYFRRRLPYDHPLYRRMVAWKSEVTRRAFNYRPASTKDIRSCDYGADGSAAGFEDEMDSPSCGEEVRPWTADLSARSVLSSRQPTWPNPRAEETHIMLPVPGFGGDSRDGSLSPRTPQRSPTRSYTKDLSLQRPEMRFNTT